MVSQFKSPSRQQTLDRSLIVGVPLIDAEHHELMLQLDRLASHTDAETVSVAYIDELTKLGEMMKAHFISEEEIMKNLPMPANEVSDHSLVHHEILGQCSQLIADMTIGNVLDQPRNLRTIRGWVVGHVRDHDLKIRKYL